MKFVETIRNGLPEGSTEYKIPNPAKQIDQYGRLKRWELSLDAPKQQKEKFRLCDDADEALQRKLHDRVFVHKLELFNEKLFKKLEKRRKAFSNWRRLKIVLTILALCGNRFEEQNEVRQIKPKEKIIEKLSFDERMARYIYLPTSKTKISWDIFISVVF